jgi:hypothetical protein
MRSFTLLIEDFFNNIDPQRTSARGQAHLSPFGAYECLRA